VTAACPVWLRWRRTATARSIRAPLATAARSGSVAWAGLFNTYYWLDPKQQVTGVIMTQILPFADPVVLHLLDEFETAVYRTVEENASHG
jgi:CubicO group peptidase (beta-lactamase class C family)